MAIFRQCKRVGPFDIRIGLPRGREYENSISIDYLSRLNERYEAWISKYNKGNLLIIDVNDLDFVKNPEDLGTIIDKIDAQINGLF